MTGSGMFSEFVNIISQSFSLLFVAKYTWLFIGVFAGLCSFIIKFVLRWFNA